MGEHGWVVRRSINLLRMLLIEINTSREDHTALRRMRGRKALPFFFPKDRRAAGKFYLGRHGV